MAYVQKTRNAEQHRPRGSSQLPTFGTNHKKQTAKIKRQVELAKAYGKLKYTVPILT